eukprot:53066-Eustigmatos_ZCMA.PRE.1
MAPVSFLALMVCWYNPPQTASWGGLGLTAQRITGMVLGVCNTVVGAATVTLKIAVAVVQAIGHCIHVCMRSGGPQVPESSHTTRPSPSLQVGPVHAGLCMLLHGCVMCLCERTVYHGFDRVSPIV